MRLRQELERAGLVVRDQRRGAERGELDVAGDQIVDRLAAAAIGHVLELMPASLANHSAAMCCCEPTPEVA